MADFAAVISLTSLDGTTGSQITAEAASNYAGQSITNLGDVNGDGIDDFAIGATGVGGSSQGAVYVVFGTASGFPANFSLTGINGTNGFQVNGGEYAQDFVGVSVAGGDVNHDGINDVIIGASGADPDGGGSGAVYVLYGKNTAVNGDFASDIATSSLTGTTGFQISGTNGGDGLGFSVSTGDFNGDGITDILVGANQADSYRGAAYVIFGKDTGVSGAFAGELNVGNLDGTNGFKMPAINAYDYAGTAVSSAGDINGDGIDDMLIGAMGVDANGSNSGAVYVVFGKNTGFGATVSLSSLDGTNGFRIAGLAAGDQTGISVSAVGDVNGDGIDDVIVGANGLTNNGGAFVLFGKNTAVSGNFASNVNVSTLDGTNGFRIDGEASGDNLGIRVSGLGDVNGDGINDFIIGATGKDDAGSNAGAAYVVFGKSSWGATVSLAGLDGTNGFQINGEAAGDNLSRVSGWGDFNNDGAMDILVATSFNDAGGNNAGATWIIYGHPSSAPTPTAPTVSGDGTESLTAINEDSTPTGQTDTVSTIFGGQFTDADDTFAGVAVTANGSTVGTGQWQYWNGSAWTDIGTSSAASATVLTSSTPLRFLPAANFNGAAPTLTVKLIDSSAGALTNGSHIDTTGASTSVSTGTVVLSQTVNAVNDAPVVSADTTASYTEGGAAVTVTPGFTVSDVDNANLTGATISVADFRTGDVLSFVNQNGISGSYNSGTGVLTLSGAATVADYQTAIRSITYSGAADANFGGTDTSRTVNITVTDGTTPSSQTATLVSIADGAAVANDDTVSTNENAVLNGNVKNNNGNGADSGVTSVTEVNGSAANVGTQITLASGALLTLNANGTFSYNPNHAFDYLAGAASGASNTSATDTFTYTVNGGDTATVTVTVNGVDSDKDVLQGSGGGDTVNGGTGNDTVNGLGGDDTLSGGAGNDTVNGGDNNDTLNGDDGNDIVNGDDGNDSLNGGTGNDKLNGGNGTDSLTGGVGADLLTGGAGVDTLNGNDGNDVLDGGLGADIMTGGLANDVYYVDDANDQTIELSGEGTDIVRNSVSWTLGTNLENLELQGTGDIDGTGNATANRLTGNSGANTLSGLAGVDTIDGGGGNDRIIGGTGNDLMTGGSGADTFVVLQESVYSSKVPAGKTLEIDFVYDLNKAEGDKLDLSAIDANASLGGDQSFSLVGAFTKHAGEMTLAYNAGTNITLLSLDTDGDGKADYQMKITGDVHLDSGGWIL